MKILIIHNQYQIHGGEDAVAESQYKLLKDVEDISVDQFIINSNEINDYGVVEKAKMVIRNLMVSNTRKTLVDKLDSFKPDVAHVHNIYPLINPYIFKELHDRGIKIVQTLHNYRFMCPNGLFYRDGHICTECLDEKSFKPCIKHSCFKDSKVHSFLYAHMINQGHKKGYFGYIDKFIALNDFMKVKMLDFGFDEAKLAVIPNGFDFDMTVDNEKEDYYLYIGRLNVTKGIKTVCESFKDIDDTLKIMGGGVLEDYVKEMALENDSIDYLGFVSGKEKDHVIQKAKAIIVPSEWYENLPTVVIEAYSKGVPVIVSNLGGAQYMVEDGVTGYVFKAGDKESLVEAIKNMNSNANVNMYQKAMEEYNKTYSTKNVLPKLIDLYRQVVKS